MKGVAAIVLAAGASARMGRAKALLEYPAPLAGWPGPEAPNFLLACTCKLRAAGAEVFAVLGHDAAEIQARVEAQAPAFAPRWVLNPDPARGQFSSLQAGVRAVLALAPAPAALVAPVDHPAFAIETARALLRAWQERGAPLVKPRCEGRNGHPVLYGREALAAIAAAGADDTARALQAQWAERAELVAVDDPGVLANIDTAEDYARLRAVFTAPPCPR